jgi:hypothetical protein
LGPLLQRLPDGRLIQNARTSARSSGMQELESAHPWASSVDLEIFLRGFDAGELYALRTLDTQERTAAVEPFSPHVKSEHSGKLAS